MCHTGPEKEHVHQSLSQLDKLSLAITITFSLCPTQRDYENAIEELGRERRQVARLEQVRDVHIRIDISRRTRVTALSLVSIELPARSG